MTAKVEIKEKAATFGWEYRTSLDFHDILLRGDEMIDITYRLDGSLHLAHRYWFFSLDNLQHRETTPAKHAKQTVFSWMAGG